MADSDVQRRLEEIQTLRRQGLISQQEAYEQHMALIASLAQGQPAVVSAPLVRPLVAPPIPPAPLLPSYRTREPLPPPEKPTYGSPGIGLQLFAIALALIGGAFGIGGAFIQELTAGGGGFLLGFTGAPIIEEALKPAGVYLLLLKWPQALASRIHVAMLSALGGLAFGAIESFVYVTVYFPHHSSSFVLFRFTVPLLMHATASFINGLGLSRGIFDWASGRTQMPKTTRNFYFAAVLLHATYNITVTILEFAGVFHFT